MRRQSGLCVFVLEKIRFAGEYKKENATADVTPRRVQKFKPKPGETVHWENYDVSNPDSPKKIAEGDVTADKHGLVYCSKIPYWEKGLG